MRIRRLLEPVNWKIALGEVVLVVFGIWIAFAANAWHAARKQQQDQLWILRQLHGSLVIDAEGLENTAQRLKDKGARIDSLLFQLDRQTS